MSIGTPLGAARDWGVTEERGESVVRANEDEVSHGTATQST